MMRLSGISVWAGILFLSVALAHGERIECSFPKDDEERHEWYEIDVYDLFEGIWSDPIREELDADINLFVEDTLIWDHSDDLLDDSHLRTFLDEIWYPNGDDICEIWDYFASGSTCSLYGEWEDPPGTPAAYNFKYPWGLTSVSIYLHAGEGSYTPASQTNKVYLDLEYPIPSPPYWEIPDDWAEGNRVPAAFCH